MDFTQEQLDAIHEKGLELLKQFINVCEKFGYKYWLIGGTLLGAVRHNGYIPWDDDVDVCMMREDYEAFAKHAQEELPEWCFLQTVDTDTEYLHNIMKIRNSNTTFIEKNYSHININHGMYIDIFPLDNYYTSGIKRKMFKMKRCVFDSYIRSLYLSCPETKNSKMAEILLKPIYRTNAGIIKGRDKLFANVKHTGVLCNYSGAWGEKEVFPEEWFRETVKMKFEGIEVNVPAEYDKILTKMYGDYMQLPPIEKRKSHHEIVAFDLEKPYTEYINLK